MLKQLKIGFKDCSQRVLLPLSTFIGRRFLAKRGLSEMVIVKVDGGFASVLMKYAMGVWFEKKWQIPVKYDLSWFKTCSMDMDGICARKFQLKKVFPLIKFDVASEEEVKVYRTWFRYKNRSLFKYAERDFAIRRPLYLDGYYASWRYLSFVRDDLIRLLKWDEMKLDTPNRLKRDEIRTKEVSVAVHIRRGDFVNLGLCFITADYYIAAIEHIRKRCQEKKITLYLFSNGFDWVRQELIPRLSDEYDIVDINDNDSGYNDLFLMSQCDHQIITNSGLGYFAAFFKRKAEGMVIVPDKITTKEKYKEDLYGMPGWIRLSSETGDFVGIHGEGAHE